MLLSPSATAPRRRSAALATYVIVSLVSALLADLFGGAWTVIAQGCLLMALAIVPALLVLGVVGLLLASLFGGGGRR